MPRVAQWLLCGDLEVVQYPEGVKIQRRRKAIEHSNATSRSMALMWRFGGCPIPQKCKNPTTEKSYRTQQCHESLNGSYVAVFQYPEGIRTQRRGKAIGRSNATNRSMALMWRFGGCPVPRGCKNLTTVKSNRTQQCHESLNGSYVAVVQFPEGIKTQRRGKAIGHSNATNRSMAVMWRFGGCLVPRGCKNSTTGKSNRTQQCHESLNGSYVAIWRLSSTTKA